MLLIVPLHKKIEWKHPPVVTLILILINVLVFLIFQLDDDHEAEVAINYYVDSGLAKLEYGPALNYIEEHGDYRFYQYMRDVGVDGPPHWMIALQGDKQYMRALHNDRIVTPQLQQYDEWKRKRQRFDELYNEITTVRYGLKAGAPSLTTLITSMFLHGGYLHLFGNMVFLLAVGFLVEITMNWKTYLSTYLLAGIGGSLLYIALKSNSLVNGIGASGAIAGLMGAYTVLYGLNKVRFFYFIGVYFDYISLPAIVLLPLWLGDQLLTMQLEPDSNVNFLVHIGGIVSGAVLAYGIKKYSLGFKAERVKEDGKKEKLEEDLESARRLMAELKPDRALQILRRLRSAMPENREVLTRSYDCSRINPSSDEYHELARAIFSLTPSDAATDTLVLETFNEYLKLAKPTTRMTPNLVCHLAQRFIRQKAIAESERLVRIILAKNLNCPQSRNLVQGFAKLLHEHGRAEEGQRYLSLVPPETTVNG